jgi:CubicO group peptidase (beta-lactamase class C family)/D-alanyl-D-alanine dipeptidase
MKLCRYFLNSVYVLLLAFSHAAAQNGADLSTAGYSDIERRLSAFIERELRDKQIPAISIALVDGDQTVLALGFGEANSRGHKATADTIYRVGSVSKLFTDLAVMRLAAAGKLDIDADVRKYLPDFQPRNPFGVPITLRQLMSHQSGLVRESPVGHYFDDEEPSLADTVKSLNETSLIYKPGTRTKYSNAGVSVAGFVVERVAGKPFEDCVRDSLLRPLEMPASGFRMSAAIEEQLATAWMRSHHAPRFVAPNFALGTLPAGNLYSNMNELSHFLIAVLGGGQYRGKHVIDEKTLASMLKPVRASGDRANQYGIGFALGEIDGHQTFGHGGAVYGYSTQLLGVPDERVGVVASAALDGANGVTRRVAEYGVRLMLARKAKKPLPEIEETKPLPPEQIAKLPGIYASGHRRLEIVDVHGEPYLHDDSFLKRLRAFDGGVVVDDLAGFGPRITVAGDDELLMNDRTWQRLDEPCPPAAPERFKPFIGEYGWDYNPLYIFEDRGQLWCLIEWFYFYPLTEVSTNVFAFPDEGLYHGEQLMFVRDGDKPATHVIAASVRFNRRNISPEEGATFKIKPLAAADELEKLAREASPPHEPRALRKPDFVELTSLDRSIKTDIRYATTNNFMGAVFYDKPRAFMQRPAAKALVRVHRHLRNKGYGLLIHDAYRPWYVTKMFWEGTPPHLRDFVADPEEGSKHNRGCAVDLTLFDLATGEAVTMVAGYDEMSPRSYPFYPGGTARQRWHRKLLREAMRREGFAVQPLEWWHFDYKDWDEYPIANVSFDEIEAAANGERDRQDDSKKRSN